MRYFVDRVRLWDAGSNRATHALRHQRSPRFEQALKHASRPVMCAAARIILRGTGISRGEWPNERAIFVTSSRTELSTSSRACSTRHSAVSRATMVNRSTRLDAQSDFAAHRHDPTAAASRARLQPAASQSCLSRQGRRRAADARCVTRVPPGMACSSRHRSASSFVCAYTSCGSGSSSGFNGTSPTSPRTLMLLR